MTTRRKFIQGAAIAVPAALATPALAPSTIKWRMQTYVVAALAAVVTVPALDMGTGQRSMALIADQSARMNTTDINA